MKLFEVGVPPGIVRLGTELQSANRWFDCNLVRWIEGVLQPIGGWFALMDMVANIPAVVSGKARGAHTWRDNGNQPFMAIGTHLKLYLYTGLELYDITPVGLVPGREDTASFSGYGVGIYGRGTYGTVRQATGATELATTWSLDNFGQNLLAIQSKDGRLMEWTGTPANPATPVAATTGTVPTGNRAILVTEERFAMILGARNDPRRVEWSEKEDYTRWAISATTSAGFLNVQTAGVIRTGCKVRRQSLILTNLDAHVADYVGYPLYYGIQRVASGCGVIGANALVASDDIAYWMGQGSFFKYDGAVQTLPCEVRDYVFSDMNIAQAEKVYGVRLHGLSEIKWFYPSASSNENDRYVAYNTLGNTWSIGTLARTCGEPKGVFPYPIYVSVAGQLYAHEQGRDYEGDVPFIESGPVEMGDASRVYDIVGVIPDERTQGQVRVKFRTRYWPEGPVTEHGPFTLSPQYTALRFSGREISVRIESAGSFDWRLGRFRFDHVLRGGR